MNKTTLLRGGITAILVTLSAVSLASAHGNDNNKDTIVVTQNSLETTTSLPTAQTHDKWFFYNDENDTIDNTLGSFVTGPADPPQGVGSAQISVTGTQRRNLATYQFRGKKLTDIKTLKITTYNPSVGNGGAANRSGYLNFNVDFNNPAYFPIDSWQSRLVYVPSANGSVTQNQWKEWDAIKNGTALWTWSRYANGPDNNAATTADNNRWPDGNISQYRTWNSIKAAFPKIRIRNTDSWLGIRVGEPYNDGYTENIDSFKFGTNDNTTTFDFEPAVTPPTNINQCRNNGWRTFNSPAFSSKEDCVRYVQKRLGKTDADIKYTANGLKRQAHFSIEETDYSTRVAKGKFFYSDANHDWYKVNVSSLRVVGDNAYFAGIVTEASNPAFVGNWLSAQAKDNHGTPDQIWGSFTNQATALGNVTNATSPADGPFTITSGHIHVD